MATRSATQGAPLDRYREYLRLLARLQLDPRLRGKVDPSDVAQQTLLRAYEGLAEFRWQGEAQLAGWLRKILANVLAGMARRFATAARDVALERSLESSLDSSSLKLEALLAADQSSPSENAVRQEDLLRLAEALARLPEEQRTAVELKHFHGLPVAVISEEMGRSK